MAGGAAAEEQEKESPAEGTRDRREGGRGRGGWEAAAVTNQDSSPPRRAFGQLDQGMDGWIMEGRTKGGVMASLMLR